MRYDDVLTVAEVGLGPRRQDDLAVGLAALGEGEGQGGRAADNLPRAAQRETAEQRFSTENLTTG